MKVKICPLCDCEMKKAHYCDACNSFIWRPEILDIHYNSETRGLGEIDCAYGSDHDQYDHSGNTLEKQKKTNKKKGIISKIIAIVIGFNLLGSLLDVAVDNIDSYGGFENAAEAFFDDIGIHIDIDQDSDDGEVYIATEEEDEDAYASDYMELSDDELSEYPDGCNGYDHFDVTSSEVMPQIEAWIEDLYGEGNVADIYTDVNNSRYVYDNVTEYVYLETSQTYQLPDDNYGYIRIGYDTVTESIHSITVSWLSPEDTELLFRAMVPMLVDGITEAEIDEAADMLFDARTADYNNGVCGELTVFITDNSDGTLWMDISPVE